MHQKKSKLIFIYFFLLIILSSISNKFINNLKLIKIENIVVSGLEQKDNQIILDKFNNLKISFFLQLINEDKYVTYFSIKSIPSLSRKRITSKDSSSERTRRF